MLAPLLIEGNNVNTIVEAAPFEIVSLTSADAGEVLTLQRAAYVSEAQLYRDTSLPALTQTLAEVADELQGPSLGARIGTRLVGAVRWTISENVAHIGRLTIVPDLQGQGIGRTLLRSAEKSSSAHTFELFTGHLSEANIRLYQREGYVIVRRETLHEGVDLIYLRKETSHPS